jgi:hypothetical protein
MHTSQNRARVIDQRPNEVIASLLAYNLPTRRGSGLGLGAGKGAGAQENPGELGRSTPSAFDRLRDVAWMVGGRVGGGAATGVDWRDEEEEEEEEEGG